MIRNNPFKYLTKQHNYPILGIAMVLLLGAIALIAIKNLICLILAIILLFAIATLFYFQTQNIDDAKFNMTLWTIANLTYLLSVLYLWNGSNWYYFLIIIFSLVFNVPFFFRCLFFSQKNLLWMFIFVSLLYFSTIGIVDIMYVYTNTSYVDWHKDFANILRNVFDDYVKSVVVAIFLRKILDK